MSLIARAVRFVFWFLVIWCGLRLLRWLFSRPAGTHAARQGSAESETQRLVRDPVCGTHVAERLALPVSDGRTVAHFCSARCRDEYLEKTRKFAANA